MSPKYGGSIIGNDAGFETYQKTTDPVAVPYTYQKEINVFSGNTSNNIKTTQLDYKPESGTMEDPRLLGPGGAPTRATTLPTDGGDRKNYPVASGVLDYFPDALVALSAISKAGNDQHNPGMTMRWDRSKSQDESDTCIRHFLQRGTLDTDGKRHTAKAAWRLLAILQKEIEREQNET
jgi:hypothetical protein